MADMLVWPLKIVRISEGIICVYDVMEKPEVGDESTLDVRFIGEEWVVVALDDFCIPVSILDVNTSEGQTLYLAGSRQDQLEAKFFATIPLDVRALTKIGLLVEMNAPPVGEHLLKIAA